MARKILIPDVNQKEENTPTEKQNNKIPTGNFVEVLKERFPNKLNFNITEAARILNLSYDFVRENILKGSIRANKFGDRYMINLFELARTLNEGVPNGN